MIKLINIELNKIFKHKSIYIVFIIIIIFSLINNILYKLDYDNDGRYKYNDNNDIREINNLKKELSKYDINNDNDKNIYLTTKTKLDILENKNRYNINTWQYIKYEDYLYDYIYEINYYKYVDKNTDLYNKSINKYKDIIKYFDADNWRYFVNKEKDVIEKDINNIEEKIKNTKDVQSKNNLLDELNKLKRELIIINYRIDKDISYSNNYLNRSLIMYKDNLDKEDNYKDIKLDYQEKIIYNEVISNININKYIIDNKININKENTLNYELRSIVDDYELFIIVMVLIVSGILIGEEFNKGTIKLLLIKPYTRNKIILSKYLSGIIVILISIMFLIITNLIIGGLLLGFDTLKMPVVIYDFNINNIRIFNIFIYMFIRILAKLSMFIILLTISILLGIIISNNIVSFAISMLLYTFSLIINNMIINYKIKILQYFITMNWNFNDYLFGGLSSFEPLNFKKSLLIYLFYVIILLGIMLISFNKKNIKNI